MLQVIALARYALVKAQAAEGIRCGRQRHGTNDDRRDQEIALLREEIRIKDVRCGRFQSDPQASIATGARNWQSFVTN